MSIESRPAVKLAAPHGVSDRAVLAELVRRKLAERADRAAPGHTAHLGAEGYRRHVAPELSRILGALDLDRSFRHAEGLKLTDAAGTVCLDFAGAYGALPFGHNDPAMWAAVTKTSIDAPPSFIQPSILEAAGQLATRLVEIAPAGIDRVTFANSGAESVEAAIKLARAATGRLGILATEGGFHGKTLGALSATGRPDYQHDFGAPAPGFAWVPYDDLEAVRHALDAAPGGYAAVIVEPIQGEGGVRVPSPHYLRGLRELCDDHGSLLIVDEVQTGLGRTGTLFACDEPGVSPDIITVAKALGGGLVPIGAVLSTAAVHSETFALRHTSTFAGGALACRVGLAALDRLREPQLLANVADRSHQLLEGLRAIARAYPGIVTAVRGRGLLIGVELSADLGLTGDQGLLGSLAEGGNLAMAICSYLLEVEGLRLAPTLFGNSVLRVEPPLTVTADECRRLLEGVARAVALVARGDTAALLGHLVGRPHTSAATMTARGDVPTRAPHRTAMPGQTRFAFVVHPLDPASLADFDPSLRDFTTAQHVELLERFDRSSSVLNPAPFVVGSGTVGTDRPVHGELLGVPYTAEQLLSLPPARVCSIIGDAVDLARDRGAEIVGLGAYTSIVTANALRLGDRGVPVTTGNAFTAAASVRAVLAAAAASDLRLAEAGVAIVGAGGAIGRAIAVALAGRVGTMMLVGRPRSRSRRLEGACAAVEAAIRDRSRDDHTRVDTRIQTGDDARAAARRASIVITASSTPHTLLGADDFRAGAIVCDVAQPPNLPVTLPAERPDLTTFAGGLVTVPVGSDFDLRYGLPAGITYACMAETMLLAVAKETGVHDWRTLISRGESLSLTALERFGSLADRHGFRLATIGAAASAVGNTQ